MSVKLKPGVIGFKLMKPKNNSFCESFTHACMNLCPSYKCFKTWIYIGKKNRNIYNKLQLVHLRFIHECCQ